MIKLVQRKQQISEVSDAVNAKKPSGPAPRTAQAGQAWAQADLGTAYELGVGVILDPERTAAWYLKSANQGYAGAQANLGVLYGNGSGVKCFLRG